MAYDTWMDRLIAVLDERWDATQGEPIWNLTYAELGDFALRFPGTRHSLSSDGYQATGGVELALRLVPASSLPQPDHRVAIARATPIAIDETFVPIWSRATRR